MEGRGERTALFIGPISLLAPGAHIALRYCSCASSDLLARLQRRTSQRSWKQPQRWLPVEVFLAVVFRIWSDKCVRTSPDLLQRRGVWEVCLSSLSALVLLILKDDDTHSDRQGMVQPVLNPRGPFPYYHCARCAILSNTSCICAFSVRVEISYLPHLTSGRSSSISFSRSRTALH